MAQRWLKVTGNGVNARVLVREDGMVHFASTPLATFMLTGKDESELRAHCAKHGWVVAERDESDAGRRLKSPLENDRGEPEFSEPLQSRRTATKPTKETTRKNATSSRDR